ncbi:uncharacterized protein PG986_002451 [Apiospora aurea]|uniref:Uncharacterized protein n=1 Tax=Apiospora aurea TaxID=335848 RepID=A0ABR1QNV7_9PEZI
MKLERINIEAKAVAASRSNVGPESIDHLVSRRLWSRATNPYPIAMSVMALAHAQVKSFWIFRGTLAYIITTNEFAGPRGHLLEAGFATRLGSLESPIFLPSQRSFAELFESKVSPNLKTLWLQRMPLNKSTALHL